MGSSSTAAFEAHAWVAAPIASLSVLPSAWGPADQRILIGTAHAEGGFSQTPTVQLGVIPWQPAAAGLEAGGRRSAPAWTINIAATHPHDGTVQDVAAISETVFVTAGSKGGIHLFQAVTEADGSVRLKLGRSWTDAHVYPSKAAAPATAVAVRPFDALDPEFASVGEDGRIVFFRPDHTSPIAHSAPDALVLSDVSFLGRDRLATVGASGHIKLWDPRQLDRPAAVLTSAGDRPVPLTTVQGRPARPDWLVTGSRAGTVALWDIRALGRVECAETALHAGAVHAVAHHPNAPHVVFSGSADGSVGAITYNDTAARPPVHRELWRHVLASQLAVNAVVVAPAQDLLIAGTHDGALLMKQVRTAS